MEVADQVLRVRRSAGIFGGVPRTVIEVTGSDRERWLGGMLSADMSSLDAKGSRSGCYAVLLTPKGRMVADLQVLARPEAMWLDVAASAAPRVIERLSKYIIADDVDLRDCSDEIARIAVEGPKADRVLASVGARCEDLADDAWSTVDIAGTKAAVASFGWTGEVGRQLFVDASASAAVVERLVAAEGEPVVADLAALEVLRIEAGVPFADSELDETVLPVEAGLERALTNPGCYTGQEVVERLRSQGQASHLLVGLVAEGDVPLVPGSEIRAADKRIGEVASSTVSPHVGAIALAFVRRAHAEPGTELTVDGRGVRVTSLPFVPAAAAA